MYFKLYLILTVLTLFTAGTFNPSFSQQFEPSNTHDTGINDDKINPSVDCTNLKETSDKYAKTNGSLLSRKSSVAIVWPTFTAAAYNHAFYDFYKIHEKDPVNGTTQDLHLLTGKITNNGIAGPMVKITAHMKQLLPEAKIVNLTDADIHEGVLIRKSSDHRFIDNTYDVVILGHQEYVTQKEYDYLKEFVSNGGILIVLEGNIFYAEVRYDKDNQTVTLIRGHSWSFDNHTAYKSVNKTPAKYERWANETSNWMGSNFYWWKLGHHVNLANNPFNYTNREAQYVNNPCVKILFDYGAKSDNDLFPNPLIATYEKHYGLGKILVLGIFSEPVMNNNKFLEFLDSLLTGNTSSNFH